jgi:hypothetical protein
MGLPEVIKPSDELVDSFLGTSKTSNSFWTPENTAPHQAHHIVVHNYHDHANDNIDAIPVPVARGGVTTAFPQRLHELLDQIEADGFAHIISWQPHGRCFVVHEPKVFVDSVMPTYFNQSKFASFQRQLNLYGFIRLTKGADKGGYYHELFLRGKVSLAHKIQRLKVKGTGVRARSSPGTEPDFYRMAPVSVVAGEETMMRAPEQPLSLPQEQLTTDETLSLPFDVDPLHLLKDEDDLVFHGGQSFAYMEPSMYDLGEAPEPFTDEEMHSFLSNLNITKGLYMEILDNVDDDDEFGNLLEKVIV